MRQPETVVVGRVRGLVSHREDPSQATAARDHDGLDRLEDRAAPGAGDQGDQVKGQVEPLPDRSAKAFNLFSD